MDRSTLIPVSIEARTRSELSAKCAINNERFDAFFKYFDFQKDGKRWVCWYYADIRYHVLKHQVKRSING